MNVVIKSQSRYLRNDRTGLTLMTSRDDRRPARTKLGIKIQNAYRTPKTVLRDQEHMLAIKKDD